MACDLCGKIVSETIELRSFYQTDKVKILCRPCMDRASKQKDFYMFKMSERMMKRWLNRNKKKAGK